MGDIFYNQFEVKMEVKKFLTFEERLQYIQNKGFIISLESLIEEYTEYIRLRDMGFPENWKEILSK